MSASDSEPKIIVDDDWKSQVEREKQQQESAATGPAGEQPYPEATFELLVTTVSMQAMSAMGLLGGPGGAAHPPDLGMARHLIDLLGVIDAKTKGNLTTEEAAMLEQMLHQLRMLYLDPQIRKQAGGAGDDPASTGSRIELP
jgi:hypothetical protein